MDEIHLPANVGIYVDLVGYWNNEFCQFVRNFNAVIELDIAEEDKLL